MINFGINKRSETKKAIFNAIGISDVVDMYLTTFVKINKKGIPAHIR